jgi:hypothetical protein
MQARGLEESRLGVLRRSYTLGADVDEAVDGPFATY